ncbi:MAG: hypothetical protein HQ559_01760 [Lentisphaerae bacterium]|nr:hypothetical protein [Lentisphaerota bacterium]
MAKKASVLEVENERLRNALEQKKADVMVLQDVVASLGGNIRQLASLGKGDTWVITKNVWTSEP